MYKPLRAKGKKDGKIMDGWKVYGLTKYMKRIVDGETFYPSRQNAYARAKVLNDMGDPMDKIVTFRILCDIEYVAAFKLLTLELLEKKIHRQATFLVLDPCFSVTAFGGSTSEREILFCIDTTAEDPNNDPLHEDWMKTQDEVTSTQLDGLLHQFKGMQGIIEATYSFEDIKFI